MKRQKQIQCFLGKKCLFKFEKMRFTQTSKSLSRSCCREKDLLSSNQCDQMARLFFNI